MGTLLLLVTAALLIASAGLVAAGLGVEGAVAFVLAAYSIAFAEVVVSIAALSPFELVTRAGLVATTTATFAASVVFWTARGRPQPPSWRAALSSGRDAVRDPLIAVLTAAVALGFAYLAALAVFTPPNSWDAMWVWLARAAFWKQAHAVGYVDDIVVLNGYPPVASMGHLYSMVVASNDRLVTLVALVAYVVTPVAVFGIARRIGLEVRAALFGALIFATLPVILLQASGALIDLPVASFLATCVYFLLGRRPLDIGLAGLAFSLALGAKLTGLLAAPVLLLLVVLARPRRVWTLIGTGIAAGAIGCAWYFLNLARTGSLSGDLSGHLQQRGYLPPTDHGVTATVARTLRIAIDFLELPGAGGWWLAAYALAAAVVAGLALRERRGAAAVAALVALSPIGVLAAERLSRRTYEWLFFHLGRPDLGTIDQERGVTGATALGSFYGPLGLFLVLSVVALVALVARRRLPRPGWGLLVAPLLFVAIVAVLFSYSSFWGRLFIFPVALAAACAGLAMRSRPLAWGVVAVAATTLVLTLRANDEKPPSVWGKPRWWVQIRVGPRDDGEGEAFRFAERSIPRNAHVGLAIDDRDWSYPFFGSSLDRTVRFAQVAAPQADLGWLVVGPAHARPGAAWRAALRTPDGWFVFRRAG